MSRGIFCATPERRVINYGQSSFEFPRNLLQGRGVADDVVTMGRDQATAQRDYATPQHHNRGIIVQTKRE